MAVMFGDDDTWVIVSTMAIQRKLAFDTEERRRRRSGQSRSKSTDIITVFNTCGHTVDKLKIRTYLQKKYYPNNENII